LSFFSMTDVPIAARKPRLLGDAEKERQVTKVGSELDQLDRLFRDAVLVLGGVFAVRGTDDETICQVARGLECVFRRARARRTDVASAPAAPRLAAPHPAILGLLGLAHAAEETTE
jgi:hypothetical protein